MSAELKTVGQVFPDEKFEDSLLRCKIKSANLYKKTNTITDRKSTRLNSSH